MVCVKVALLRESKCIFLLQIKIIFQLHIYFHVLDVPLLAGPLGRISIGTAITYKKKWRALSDSNLSCSQSGSI